MKWVLYNAKFYVAHSPAFLGVHYIDLLYSLSDHKHLFEKIAKVQGQWILNQLKFDLINTNTFEPWYLKSQCGKKIFKVLRFK